MRTNLGWQKVGFHCWQRNFLQNKLHTTHKEHKHIIAILAFVCSCGWSDRIKCVNYPELKIFVQRHFNYNYLICAEILIITII